MSLRNYFLMALVGAVICSVVIMAGQQPVPAGPYTAAQSTAGRAAYQANCSSCHLPTLGGQGRHQGRADAAGGPGDQHSSLRF